MKYREIDISEKDRIIVYGYTDSVAMEIIINNETSCCIELNKVDLELLIADLRHCLSSIKLL